MPTFLELYDSEGATMHEDAFQYLVTDMIQSQTYGDAKSRTVTAFNLESELSGDFIPSVFYTFIYSNAENKNLDTNTFVDVVPLVLCTSVSAAEITGINFNLIPCRGRAAILDIIYDGFSSFYKNASSSSPVNEEFAAILSNPSEFSSFMNVIKSKTGMDISAAWRKYTRSRMRRARMIEYDMWKYIPSLEFNDSIRGMNLRQAQRKTIIKTR